MSTIFVKDFKWMQQRNQTKHLVAFLFFLKYRPSISSQKLTAFPCLVWSSDKVRLLKEQRLRDHKEETSQRWSHFFFLTLSHDQSLSVPVSIVHRFQQIFQATSCIGTAPLYRGSTSSKLCSFMWKDSQENIAHEFVLTSTVVSCVFGSSNFDSFLDGR